MFCGKCGSQNPDENKFCSGCGSPLAQNEASNTKTSVPETQEASP